MDSVAKSVARAILAISVLVLISCSDNDPVATAEASEAIAGTDAEQVFTLEEWSDSSCGNALIYRDGVSAGLRVGAEEDGTTCSLSDSIQSLVELPQSELDRATVVVVYGDVNLNDLPSFMGRLHSTEELAFVSRRVEGDPQLGADNKIFNMSFRTTTYADLRAFTPMPELVRLTTAIEPVDDGEMILPTDIGASWPSLRAISDDYALITNLTAINTATEPLILFIASGHPQLGELTGPLERVNIFEEAQEAQAEAVERLRARGVPVQSEWEL